MSLSINHLPPHLLSFIFSKLSVRELGLIASVCKKWHVISSSDRVWNNFQIHTWIPSNIKSHTVNAIKKAALFMRKVKEIPHNLQLNDPSLAQQCADKDIWCLSSENAFYLDYLNDDFSQIDTPVKVMRLLTIVTGAFKSYIKLDKINYTSLQQAENLALKFKDTFKNPHPFLILAAEYRKKGNTKKEEEMKKFAQQLSFRP